MRINFSNRVSRTGLLLLSSLGFGVYGFAHEGEHAGQMEAGHHKMHQSMEAMHKDMMGMTSKGDTDHDFVSMMIRHHQGAIEMAQIEIDQGKDEKAKEIAKKMVMAQKKEIAELQDWQKNKKPSAKASR